jgi:hypothetical protein
VEQRSGNRSGWNAFCASCSTDESCRWRASPAAELGDHLAHDVMLGFERAKVIQLAPVRYFVGMRRVPWCPQKKKAREVIPLRSFSRCE